MGLTVSRTGVQRREGGARTEGSEGKGKEPNTRPRKEADQGLGLTLGVRWERTLCCVR